MKCALFGPILIILILSRKTICESNADILNAKVERLVDLSSHLAKIITFITIENKGKSTLNSYTFVIEPNQAKNVVYINAQVIVAGEDKLF